MRKAVLTTCLVASLLWLLLALISIPKWPAGQESIYYVVRAIVGPVFGAAGAWTCYSLLMSDRRAASGVEQEVKPRKPGAGWNGPPDDRV